MFTGLHIQGMSQNKFHLYDKNINNKNIQMSRD